MLYASSTRKPNQMGPVGDKQVPFIVYAHYPSSVVSTVGFRRRFEVYRDLEKGSIIVEDALLDAGFNIATPIAFTLQMAQAPARFTIVGFASEADLLGTAAGDPTVDGGLKPETWLIHSGTIDGEKTEVKQPPQGNQSWGDDPTDTNRAYVATLKSALEAAAPGLNIFYMEVNGVKYGQIPNRHGFQSFPS